MQPLIPAIGEFAMTMRPAALANFALLSLLLVLCATSCTGGFDAATAAPRDGHLIAGRAAVVYSSRYEIDLGGLEKSHSFDIHKYGRMARALVAEGYLKSTDFYVPAEVTREQLLLVHTPQYLSTLGSSKAVSRYMESEAMKLLPAPLLDSGVLRAFRTSTGGTILAARQALVCGLGINLGGGYHHAHPDHGEGFCVYADVPIAVRVLQKEGLIRRVLLVDLDVHQGNGNAVCFAGDDDVFTFDIHEADIYPSPKAEADLNVPLVPPVDDQRYLATLRQHLPDLLTRTRPDLVVVLGGVDTYRDDPLAHFDLSLEGIVTRDEYAVGEARRRNLPVLYVTSGGYSDMAWVIQFRSIANLLVKFAGVVPTAPAAGATPGKSAPKGAGGKNSAEGKGS